MLTRTACDVPRAGGRSGLYVLRPLGLLVLLMFGLGAASIPLLEVTGRPASPGFLGEVVGAPVAEPLEPGQQALAGGVRLRNLQLPEIPVQALAFSDHPERVLGRGLLFDGGLLPFKPVRFQYYHEGGRDDLSLRLLLFNRGREPARVHWIGAAGGPDAEYFDAGHANNRRFLERLARFEGRVEVLPAGEARTLALHRLPREQVVSGTAQMTLLEGGGVGYALFAVQDPDEPVGFCFLSNPRDVHARGVYPAADQWLVRSWVVGKEEGRVTLGSVRQPNVLVGPELKGDYGVVYRVEVALYNPGAAAAEVELLFNPRGGRATGTFLLLDGATSPGRWLEAGPTEAFELVPLTSLTLGPREARNIQVWTIPEGASNYPVRLVLRKRGCPGI